jgi:hypothetical protein
VLALARASTDTWRLTVQAHPGLNYSIEGTANFTHWTVVTNSQAAS